MIVGVHHEGHPDLMLIADAPGLMGFGFGPRQRWQQERCQDGDYGDDDQQFDECERRVPALARFLPQHFHGDI